MFEFWNKLSTLQKILIIALIILVIVVIIVFITIKFRKSKEGYTTMLNKNSMTNSETGELNSGVNPLNNYVNSWIKSVKDLYTAKSVNENYVESRTMKNFNQYTYLDKNSIVTGINKY